MTSTIGIPIKLLNEAQVSLPIHPPHSSAGQRFPPCTNTLLIILMLQGHVVTLEITSGQVYRGKLLEGASSIIPARIPDLYK
jgi:hypothetical protein